MKHSEILSHSFIDGTFRRAFDFSKNVDVWPRGNLCFLVILILIITIIIIIIVIIKRKRE